MKTFEIDIEKGFHGWIHRKSRRTVYEYERMDFCSYVRSVMLVLLGQFINLLFNIIWLSGVTAFILMIFTSLGKIGFQSLGWDLSYEWWNLTKMFLFGFMSFALALVIAVLLLMIITQFIPWLWKKAFPRKEKNPLLQDDFVTEAIRTRFSKYCIKLKVKNHGSELHP